MKNRNVACRNEQVPLLCCNDCFDILYFDADGKPLKGELAGDIYSASSPGGEASASPPGGDIGARVEGGPKDWRIFRCYDEY